MAIETGMRAGELPSLKWSDIKSNHFHIHSQQLSNRKKVVKSTTMQIGQRMRRGYRRAVENIR
ncbi:tyrosine-type recombinase/integrase [Butyrivibrio sp. WCE2006]|uniref:tyrosine-type recombinase/integrase n=1 Tax=Butyrivibrio sp. WCE2006 TaxID=1410611 RepID=UPI0005D16AFD